MKVLAVKKIGILLCKVLTSTSTAQREVDIDEKVYQLASFEQENGELRTVGVRKRCMEAGKMSS
jgi:hypothetical protein